MSLQVLTRGSHQQIINGKKVVNKHYGVSLDNNQVNGIIIDNNNQYKFHDSLEHFLQKMSSNKLSLFDLLQKEQSTSNLTNPHYQLKAKSKSKSKSKSKAIIYPQKLSKRHKQKSRKIFKQKKGVKQKSRKAH
jgi:hypothetical protein